MSKVDYIIVPEPCIKRVRAKNPKSAYEEYVKNNPGIKNIAIIARSAFKLNGKRMKPEIV